MIAVLSKIAKSITVSYSEVFPNQENDCFHLAYIGKLFLITDSYCMNPACTCEEAVLYFLQVYPREVDKADSFTIRYKLNGKGFKIYEHGRFSKREIENIVRHFTADATVLNQLNHRNKEMKEKAKEFLG